MKEYRTNKKTLVILNFLCALGVGYGRDCAIVDLQYRRLYIFGKNIEKSDYSNTFQAKISYIEMAL